MKKKDLLPLMMMVMMPVGGYAQIIMNIDASQRGPKISPYQYGLFFEEINHAGEGGLYAELVRNRSFEDGTDAWSTINNATFSLISSNLMNAAQSQAIEVNTLGASATNSKGIANTGYWGMSIVTDSTYTLTLWAKGSTLFSNNIQAQLLSEDGKTILGTATLQGSVNNNGWSKLSTTIKATGTDAKGQLAITTTVGGKLTLDMVSLFPYTWKNRNNGLRPDLAQLLDDTHPSFLRFPGGCYVEGMDSYENAFQWKKTIGPIEERPGHYNRNWNYLSSDGLGYDEYLQMCEDMGAAPLFVVNVGLGHGFTFSLEQTKALVQDALDAIEYANGDATTEWGAKRIANGHAAPYNLKFIEIGNENYQASSGAQSDQYAERYNMFYSAIKEKYPEITTIGNVEAWGTDNPSWRNDYPVELVDEHYYRTYEWMRNNYRKYDNYSRQIGVYNGEYAANGGNYGKYGNLNSALGEAIYMMGMEKNSDVCKMASFAPIFMNEQDATWAYDMIHFNAANHFVTPSYHVQKMMNVNLGKQNLVWTESNNVTTADGNRQVGVGTWNTTAVYDDVKVTDASGNQLAADDFSGDASAWTLNTGNWAITDGALAESAKKSNCTAILNTPINNGNYILKLRAKKTAGDEGFLIVFNYKDSNNYTWWNIGGWGNTRDIVENCVNGSKTNIAEKTGYNNYINTTDWYDLEIQVNGNQVKCIMNGNTIHEFTLPTNQAVYQSAQIDEENGEMILKIANPNSSAQQVSLNVKNMKLGNGTVQRLMAADGTLENTMEAPNTVAPENVENITVDGEQTTALEIPAYSLNIYRMKISDIGQEVTTDYPAYEQEDAGMNAYLFAHMHKSSEITCFATSRYGNYWEDLLGGAEAFDTKANTVTGGMRDAFLCRKHDGEFMLVGTDMTAGLGWTSNHIMDLMLSPDLTHWTKNVKIDLESDENLAALGGITASDMTAAWAPQVIYDKASGNYVLYYSVGFPDRHRIYYQLIDKDLNILSKPALYFDPGYDVIDADIVWNEVDQQYVMIYKCEKSNGFDRATSSHLVPATSETEGVCAWTVTPDFHIGENNQSIEAPTQWRPIGSKKWKLAYINYSGNGYGYKFRDMDEQGLNVSEPTYISGSVAAQHGSIIKITEAEYSYLKTWEAVKTLLPTVENYYKASKDETIGAAITQANDALNNSTTVTENHTNMAAALKALQTCASKYEEYIKDQMQQGNAVDLTSLITNADFSEGSNGWTTSTAFTQANGKVAEYWNTNFDFSQEISGLMAGDYEVTVQSFFRQGSKETAYAAHQDGTESLDAIVYANAQEMPVASLYSADNQYTYTPYTFPDNVTAANQAFNDFKLYTDTLRVNLATEGSIKLGIKKENYTYSDWCCFDNFTLKYMGNPTGIHTIATETTNKSNVYYNMNGQKVDKDAVKHGVYLYNGKVYIK